MSSFKDAYTNLITTQNEQLEAENKRLREALERVEKEAIFGKALKSTEALVVTFKIIEVLANKALEENDDG